MERIRVAGIIKINGGYAFKSNDFIKEGIRVIRISDFNENGFVNSNQVYYKYDSFLEPFILEEKDILLCMTGGTVGKSFFIKGLKERMVTNQRVATIKIFGALEEYINLVILSPITQKIIDKSKNSTNDNISMNTINNFIVPFPPFEEQIRIVKKYEAIKIYVEEYKFTEEKLIKLNANFPRVLKKSILQEAIQGKLVPQDPNDEPASVLLERIREEKQKLIKEGKIKRDKHDSVISRRDNSYYEKHGSEEVCIDNELPFDIPNNWSWVRFADIVVFENGDRSSTYPVEADYVSDGIPFFGAKDMGDKYMEFSTVRFITQEKFAQLGNGKLHNGDLVCLLRGSVGKTRIFKENEKYTTGFICAQMMIIRCLDINILDYLYILINSPYYRKTIESKITGTAVRQLPAREVANILIPLPPLNEQHRIIEKISDIF